MITISRNEIHEFVLLLREQGIQVGVSEHLDAQMCCRYFFPERTVEDSEYPLFLALRSALVKRREDYEAFARAYEDFFLMNSYFRHGVNIVPKFARESRPDTKRLDIASPKIEKEEQSQQDEKKAIMALYSHNRSQIPPIDMQNARPFRPEDIKFIARKIRRITRLNQALPGRRKSFHSGYWNGSYVDWRRLAKLISSNPDTIPKIRFRKRKPARSRLVVMADVSGSMLKEAELVINSLFVASRRFHGTEAFVFSTNLSKLTSFFSNASPNLETMQRFYSKQTEIELGSGTRIGENLAKVLRDYPTVITRKTTLIIISDGWDLGDITLLGACLNEVKMRGARVVWFHPHFGHPDFSPETLAMKTAMPYIDLMMGQLSRANQID